MDSTTVSVGGTMGTKGFSVGEAIRSGWEDTADHLGLFAGLMVVTAIPYAATYAIEAAIGGVAGQIVTSIVDLLVIGTLVGVGWISVSLRRRDDGEATLADFVARFILYVRMFIASIVFWSAVLVGLVLLVVPGVIVFLRLGLYGFLIVDRELGPMEALSESWRITRGASWDLFGFWLVFLFILVLAAIPLGLGLLVAWPVYYLAFTHVYRTLLRMAEGEETAPA